MIVDDKDYNVALNELQMLYKTLTEAREKQSVTADAVEKEFYNKKREIEIYEMRQEFNEALNYQIDWGKNSSVSLRELEIPDTPRLSNRFTVELPIPNIKKSDVKMVNLESGSLEIILREPETRNIVKDIYDFRKNTELYNDENDDKIILNIVNGDETVAYRRIFNNVRLIHVSETSYDYSDSDSHNIALTFAYENMKFQDGE